MAKPRDHKATYARRKARAQAQGFSGYSQKRSAQVRAKVMAEKVAERLESWPGWDAETLDDLLSDEAMQWFWEQFRNYYGKGTAA